MLLLIFVWNSCSFKKNLRIPEAATQRCSQKKVFWKYAANLQENTHVEVFKAILLRSHFGMGVLL